MINNIINLSSLLMLGVAYVYGFYWVLKSYSSFYFKTKTNAILIVYFASLLASCVNLVHISDAASDAFLYFSSKDQLLKGIFYSALFFLGAWIFSIVFVRLSFLIVSSITPEDETDELIKNNTEIAWLHAIILVSLTFVIAPAIVKIAVSFIPYPELPF